MGLKRISKDDHFGIFYVKKPDGAKWDSYYRTLNALRPLFEDKEFSKVVNGFYLNVYGKNFDLVRISYFVDKTKSKKAVSIFKQFFGNNGILRIKDSEPKEKIVAESYGGEEFEERFRNFLVLETQIGLELINGDLLQARRLFAIYIWQVRRASLPLREHFEPTLKKYSATYNSLSDDEKNQFSTDLQKLDWAHMMVNFVLGCDWKVSFGKPLSILEINELVKNLGFQIPLD